MPSESSMPSLILILKDFIGEVILLDRLATACICKKKCHLMRAHGTSNRSHNLIPRLFKVTLHKCTATQHPFDGTQNQRSQLDY